MPTSYNLLFDIGNVITEFDFQLTIDKIAKDCSAPKDNILKNVMVLKDDLETGTISSEAFIDQTITNLGYTGDRAFLTLAFQDVFKLNAPMVDLITEESKKATPLYLLSNTSGIHVDFLFDRYEVFHLFDQAIYSHEVGLMKPDPDIYTVTASKLGIDPAKTIYIDDLPENIEAGRKFGFQSILYDVNNHQAFIEQYEALRKTLLD